MDQIETGNGTANRPRRQNSPRELPVNPVTASRSEPAFSTHAPATQLRMYTRRRVGGVGMLSLAKARKDYYLQKVGEISPREDYYLKGGTASGSWHGSGAAEMGIDGAVTAEGLVRLFDGQHPDTGEQLGHRLRKDGVAAWDLTFSADKSVSLLWAFGDDEVRVSMSLKRSRRPPLRPSRTWSRWRLRRGGPPGPRSSMMTEYPFSMMTGCPVIGLRRGRSGPRAMCRRGSRSSRPVPTIRSFTLTWWSGTE